MSWNSWFYRLFGKDKKAEFCARVFAALVIAGDELSVERLEQAKEVGRMLFPAGPQRERFSSLLHFYMEECVTEQLDLNLLVKRIVAEAKKNPEWLEEVPEESYRMVKISDAPLQTRVLEMLENLKKNGFRG